MELPVELGLGGSGGAGPLLLWGDDLASLAWLIQGVIVNQRRPIAFSIPAGGVGPSWFDGPWPPIGAFSLSLTARPCLTTLPTAGAFGGFGADGPLAGTAIEDCDELGVVS